MAAGELHDVTLVPPVRPLTARTGHDLQLECSLSVLASGPLLAWGVAMGFAGTAERLMTPTVSGSTTGGPCRREFQVPSSGDRQRGLPFDSDTDVGPGASSPPPAAPGGAHHRQLGIVFAIGIGGAVGAVGRYAVSLAFPTAAGGFPWSTFLVNVTGSAVLGLILVLLVERFPRGGLTRLIVGTGIIGAYTTFSTFEVDALNLIRGGHSVMAVLYMVASVFAGLGACWVGMVTVRGLLQFERRTRESA